MVTVHDVARAAGVSISTVSRALAAPERVAAETRERVTRVATELGYRPNHAASGLRMGRTHAVGLVVPDLENPYFASVTKGVQARARAEGYEVFVADTDEDADAEPELIGALAARTDGLIVASPRSGEAELRAALVGVTAVLANRELLPAGPGSSAGSGGKAMPGGQAGPAQTRRTFRLSPATTPTASPRCSGTCTRSATGRWASPPAQRRRGRADGGLPG
ncbi:LacI family DNA-binding transcriptional regulator [Promicromonospora sp. Populi]|uniref:LacI family DNA-binding transcriptional regulator n=1 Tax=Promicromonospora sp. Populi TaxID=3239420 RepID=UPI0034E2AC49